MFLTNTSAQHYSNLVRLKENVQLFERVKKSHSPFRKENDRVMIPKNSLAQLAHYKYMKNVFGKLIPKKSSQHVAIQAALIRYLYAKPYKDNYTS